mgnify:CR=1 FL=1
MGRGEREAAGREVLAEHVAQRVEGRTAGRARARVEFGEFGAAHFHRGRFGRGRGRGWNGVGL